jgi:hypothetical protein
MYGMMALAIKHKIETRTLSRKGENAMAREEIKKQDVALMVVGAVYDAIESAGERGLPSGELYAALMGRMSLDTYQAIIDILVKVDKIKNTGHLLTAI